MKPVYAIASNIVSSLGLTTVDVWSAIAVGKSGIQQIDDPALSPRPIWASRLSTSQFDAIRPGLPSDLSPLEMMGAYSLKNALEGCSSEIDLSKTLFVFTTTKGNIEWLGKKHDDRNRLTTSASYIAEAAGITTIPTVISHACVSGVTGLIYAMRALNAGWYDTAIVTGVDRLTAFVVSGFASFQALADERCRPFDADRKGINLGEAAATIVLSTKPQGKRLARLSGGATSNDANHISGPSRTGEELSLAIGKAIKESGLSRIDINLISAHGTATIYNDEMESKAFAHAGLLHAPIHSIKGYLGHTLGAAGVLESALLIEAISRQHTIASAGYSKHGVSQLVHITTAAGPAPIRHALKTASGFGGCNAAIIWSHPEIK
jgi:3-oxoacyl-[acyl-carrier-protein] synthase-1